MSINRAILLGRVGRDPEMKPVANSTDTVATFSLATDERWRDKATGEQKQATEWHNIVCYNQAINKVIEAYVKKGTAISVEGQIKTRKWQDRDTGKDRYSTEIVIGRFDGRLSLEGQPQGQARGDEHSYGNTTTRNPAGTTQPPAARATSLDDDIPF